MHAAFRLVGLRRGRPPDYLPLGRSSAVPIALIVLRVRRCIGFVPAAIYGCRHYFLLSPLYSFFDPLSRTCTLPHLTPLHTPSHNIKAAQEEDCVCCLPCDARTAICDTRQRLKRRRHSFAFPWLTLKAAKQRKGKRSSGCQREWPLRTVQAVIVSDSGRPRLGLRFSVSGRVSSRRPSLLRRKCSGVANRPCSLSSVRLKAPASSRI